MNSKFVFRFLDFNLMPTAGSYIVVYEVAHGITNVILKTFFNPYCFLESFGILAYEIGILTEDFNCLHRSTEKSSVHGFQLDKKWKVFLA